MPEEKPGEANHSPIMSREDARAEARRSIGTLVDEARTAFRRQLSWASYLAPDIILAAFNNALVEIVAQLHEAAEEIEKAHDEVAGAQRVRDVYREDAQRARMELVVARASHEAFRVNTMICARCIKLLRARPGADPDVVYRIAQIGDTCTKCGATVVGGVRKPTRHLCCGTDERYGHDRRCPVHGDLEFREPKLPSEARQPKEK